MVVFDFSGNYTNAENCPANAIGVIVSEGKIDEGKYGKQVKIDIEVNGQKLIHSIKQAEGKSWQAKYGNDTKNWVGKKFRVAHIPRLRNGAIVQSVVLLPIDS